MLGSAVQWVCDNSHCTPIQHGPFVSYVSQRFFEIEKRDGVNGRFVFIHASYDYGGSMDPV